MVDRVPYPSWGTSYTQDDHSQCNKSPVYDIVCQERYGLLWWIECLILPGEQVTLRMTTLSVTKAQFMT